MGTCTCRSRERQSTIQTPSSHLIVFTQLCATRYSILCTVLLPHTHIHTHSLTHSLTRTHKTHTQNTHTHTLTHTHKTHTQSLTHSHTHTKHTHTITHSLTHTHKTHTHNHSLTNTHTQNTHTLTHSTHPPPPPPHTHTDWQLNSKCVRRQCEYTKQHCQ